MKIGQSYERLSHQTFTYDEWDVKRLVQEDARRSSLWAPCPRGCVERIEVEIIDEEQDGGDRSSVTKIVLRRTFSQACESPQAVAAVDPVGELAERDPTTRERNS